MENHLRRAHRPYNPWPKWLSFVTMGLALKIWAIGLYALIRENPRRLPAYVGFLVAGATVARRELCARCPYYGEYCTMLIGKWTAVLYEPRDEAPTTISYLLDGFIGGSTFLYPLPEVSRRSWKLLAFYLAIAAAFAVVSLSFSCRRCPMEGCPLNRIIEATGMKSTGGP